MACSRMPKCRLRPLNTSNSGSSRSWPFARSTEPASLIKVSVDGARSADPPMTYGTCAASFWITCCETARVAVALSTFAASISSSEGGQGHGDARGGLVHLRRLDQLQRRALGQRVRPVAVVLGCQLRVA